MVEVNSLGAQTGKASKCNYWTVTVAPLTSYFYIYNGPETLRKMWCRQNQYLADLLS